MLKRGKLREDYEGSLTFLGEDGRGFFSALILILFKISFSEIYLYYPLTY